MRPTRLETARLDVSLALAEAELTTSAAEASSRSPAGRRPSGAADLRSRAAILDATPAAPPPTVQPRTKTQPVPVALLK